MRRAAAVCLLALAGLAAPAAAQDASILITPGSARDFGAGVQLFADRSVAPKPDGAKNFREVLAGALAFSGVFRIVPEAAFLGSLTTESLDESVLCAEWSQVGVDALVQGELRADQGFEAEFRVWDTARCTVVERKRYRQPSTAEAALVARRMADDIVAAFIGIRGVASTEIAFVSNRTGNPEVFVMAADGSNPRPATANRSINNFPGWSPDGQAIVYTSYRQDNRPMLFLSTRGQGRPGRLLRRLGGDRGEFRGVFSPRGDRLAVVLAAEGGSADLFTVQPDGSGLTRITDDRAIDISPAWSPDGQRLAFVSDRAGSPQIYLSDLNGGPPRRLTFQGSYNTHPAWSPDGRWIAYETRVEGQFDIWLIDPEGEVNLPLITHPRSDESPTWAPNSRKLAFSSRRRGRADIYVVDVNGDNLRRVTGSEGDDTSPSWGPFPR